MRVCERVSGYFVRIWVLDYNESIVSDSYDVAHWAEQVSHGSFQQQQRSQIHSSHFQLTC